MKTTLNLLLLTLFLTFATSCSTDSTDDLKLEDITIPEAKEIEIEIMELINAYRIEQGLNALSNHDLVKSQAYSHSSYMVEENNVSHVNFYSRKSFLVNNAGASVVTENVAFGFKSAQSVVNAWINSVDHRINMEGNYTNFDVSAEKNDQGKWYFTNIFMK
ncbi:CAP domain-containing protein [Lacinutrix sp. Bg11-31]|uniref:CAP domain-containing protein n=1 Tax=Lacinutrix sp. Bg11-31 TaxID=2057808 RepID=UPI000C30E93F|nr:CAP domain-containing protein [Lacinutrix sp. Bg11-31]AUC81629.1 CAP domain-containing protein [Lacinutrix sp. Bg11-31]